MPRRPPTTSRSTTTRAWNASCAWRRVPSGPSRPDGHFNFSACYTHNYREFMGGFTDWVEQVADSKNALDYRKRVTDPESASMWQSLSFGANYKAAYCLAVCPAGEDVIGPYLTDKAGHLRTAVRPLQEKEETVYVVRARTPKNMWPAASPARRPSGSATACGPRSIQRFLSGLPLTFQRDQRGGWTTRLPLHLHGHGGMPGDRGHPGLAVQVQDGPHREGRAACNRRQRDVAGVPGEGESISCGDCCAVKSVSAALRGCCRRSAGVSRHRKEPRRSVSRCSQRSTTVGRCTTALSQGANANPMRCGRASRARPAALLIRDSRVL